MAFIYFFNIFFKSIAFLYTYNEQYKKKLRKRLHLQKHQNSNKFNQKSVKIIHWKLQNIVKRNFKT